MHYKIGEIVRQPRRNGPYKEYEWMILEYLGFDTRKYRREKNYSIEKYHALNLETGEEKTIYVAVEFFNDVDTSETCYKMRTDVPDDSMEANLMFDTLKDWLVGKRSSNTALAKVEQKHQDRLNRIREALKDETLSKYLRQGLNFHLIQKESPSLIGLNEYDAWKRSHPAAYQQLLKIIYENTINN